MMEVVVLLGVAVFFAVNMGVSGFAVAFTPSYGARLIGRRAAAVLYTAGVALGACWFGPRVVETLVRKIAGAAPTPESGLMILMAAGVTLFGANMLRVPQSTSFVAVAAFAGAAFSRGAVHWGEVGRVFWVALLFSALSFVLAFLAQRGMYPPRPENLRLYEWIGARRAGLRRFIVGHDIFAAFSVGTNNVANAVAVVAGIGLGSGPGAFLLFSVLFGLGALVAGDRVLRTVARDIVPLGEVSASLVSLITASFVFAASWMGLPAPYVQFTSFAVLGISCVKDGFRETFGKAVVQKMFWVWGGVPAVAFALSYGLHRVFLGR